MISIVIPNYNGSKVLVGCLNALTGQTETNFEIILVDNGSHDDSVTLTAERYPDVKIIRNEKNLGFAAAINTGIRHAQGEYVALLNNDVEAEPGWLSELKKALDADPMAFAAGPKLLLNPERHRINVVGIKLKRYFEAASIGAGQEDAGQFDQPGQVFGVSAGAALYRKSVFEDVGYFDEDFFAYLEDVDLSFRARLLGYRSHYVPTARAYHLKGWTTRKQMTNSFEIRQNSRNYLYVQYKNIPTGLWRQHRGSICLRHLELFFRHTLQRLHKGDAGPYLAGKWDFIMNRSTVLEKRRALQQARRVSDESIAWWLGREVEPDDEVPA